MALDGPLPASPVTRLAETLTLPSMSHQGGPQVPALPPHPLPFRVVQDPHTFASGAPPSLEALCRLVLATCRRSPGVLQAPSGLSAGFSWWSHIFGKTQGSCGPCCTLCPLHAVCCMATGAWLLSPGCPEQRSAQTCFFWVHRWPVGLLQSFTSASCHFWAEIGVVSALCPCHGLS